MPLIVTRRFLLVLALLLGFCAPSRAGALYDELSRAKEVKVWAAPFTDPSQTKLDLEKMRADLGTALKERKSIHFNVLDAETGAKLTIETELKGYTFSLTDPVDMLVGVGAAA